MATRRRRVVNSLIVAAFVVVGIAGFVPVFPSGALLGANCSVASWVQ